MPRTQIDEFEGCIEVVLTSEVLERSLGAMVLDEWEAANS